MVNSTKTITKAIADGKVEITAADLGTDKASDWTVLEVVFGGNKMMADVTSDDDKITVTLDDADSTFSGDVEVTLTYEAAMNITEDAQLPPVVVVQGGMVDADGNFIGKPIIYESVRIVGADADFSALTNGNDMFYGSTSLTSFTSDMPVLTDGGGMFDGSTSLTSFTSDMPALTEGGYMFSGCRSLTSFSGDLSALTNGDGMFYGCKLDLDSVNRIASTINDLKSQSMSGWFTIGVNSSLVTQAQQDAANAILVNKGWTVNWQRN